MVLPVGGALVVEEVAVPSEGPVMIFQVALQYMIKDIPKKTWVDITITILGPIRNRSIRIVVLRISSVIQMPLAGMIRVMGMEIFKMALVPVTAVLGAMALDCPNALRSVKETIRCTSLLLKSAFSANVRAAHFSSATLSMRLIVTRFVDNSKNMAKSRHSLT
jgi:hypothetical protein